MHCRYHASQLRRHQGEFKEKGAEIVAVGTGDARYARAFIDDEEIGFPVLLDEEGDAAEIAELPNGGWFQLAGPRTAAGVLKATAAGKRQHKIGKRPKQLGATFVIGPGDVVHYEHVDNDVSDHAPFEEILAALEGAS
ncbi:MAG: peroxiredoxin-like family protein [Actinomycetota bacterium]